MVEMTDEEYRRKVQGVLENTESYEKTDKTAEDLGLFPKSTRLPGFYGLPKIHKVGAPLRPVVAASDGPMSRLSALLERILHQLLKFIPAHIGSTQDAISSLKRIFPDLKAP